MKTKLLFILVLLCNMLLFNSCNPDTAQIEVPVEITGNLEILEQNFLQKKDNSGELSFVFYVDGADQAIKMESSIQNSQLESSIAFKDKNSEWEVLNTFTLNLLNENFRENMNLEVEEKAKILKMKYDEGKIDRLDNILDELPKLLFKELGRDKYFNESTLSVFYHLAVFKTAKRSYDRNIKDCNCGDLDTYIYEESPFFCAEDKIVSADEVYALIKSLSQERKFAGNKFNPIISLNYLESKSGELISASTIDKILRDEFENFWNKELSTDERRKVINENYTLSMVKSNVSANSEDPGYLPYDPSCLLFGARTGGECGCCGNYSGPCYYCSVVCYTHDQTCETCTPRWYCFSGCVPGSC